MRIARIALSAISLIFAFTVPARADLIYESATLGPTGQYLGSSITWEQNLGARFYLSEPTHVTAIGGHFAVDRYGSDPTRVVSIFGAIISLPSATALPSFPAWDIGAFTLAHTLIQGTHPSSDTLVPLDVSLNAGYYGLIFGGADTATGFFPLGATTTGVMPKNGVDLPEASYFFSSGFNGSRWVDGTSHGFSGARFVVEGEVTSVPSIPEPEIYAMMIAGLGLLGFVARRKKLRAAVA